MKENPLFRCKPNLPLRMLLLRQFELAFYISHHVFVLLGKGVLIVLLVDRVSNGLDHSLGR
jgi:hypothetical protein